MDRNMAIYFYSVLSPNLTLSQQGFGENSQTTSLCIRLLDALTHTERSSSLPSFPLPCQFSQTSIFPPMKASFKQCGIKHCGVLHGFCLCHWEQVLKAGGRNTGSTLGSLLVAIICFFTDIDHIVPSTDIIAGLNTANQLRKHEIQANSHLFL